MAIQYQKSKLFVWLNGLVSSVFYPFLTLIDFRQRKIADVVLIEQSKYISIDMSHFHFNGDAYWKGFKTFKTDNLFYVEIPNASIISKGIVVDSENRIILESTIFQSEYLNNLNSNHLLFFKAFLPKRRETKVISLLNKLDNNYFHWTLESLTRLLLIYEKPFFQDYKILVKANSLPFIQESLNFLFNISEENIITKNLQETLEVEKALVVSFPHIRNLETELTNVYYPEVIRKLNFLAHNRLEFMRKDSNIGPKNFIISRKEVAIRRILNEEQLIENLSEFNFKSVVLEELTFIEQVALFEGAAIIIAPHGAGIANIIYAKSPILIEIFPEGRNIRDAFYYTQLTAALNIEHHLFLQKPENNLEDIFLDEAVLDKIKEVISECQ